MTHSSLFQVQSRTISYRRVGQGERKILFFHGFPGSSAQVLPFKKYQTEFNLDVLCIDRPGYNKTSLGSSEPFYQANADALSLTKELGWQKFEVISVSGGTPYLFSLLNSHSNLISRASVISGLGPIGNAQFKKVLPLKSLISLYLLPITPEAIFILLTKNPKLIRLFLKPSMSDLAVLKKIENLKILETALHEAFAQNGIGPKQDAKNFLKSWPINPEKYPTNIQVWHGKEDQIIPVDMAKKLAQQVPQAKLNILANEGHYSLAFNYINQILKIESKDTELA